MKNLVLALYMLLLLYLPVVPFSSGQRLAPPKSYHSEDEDDDQPLVPDDDREEIVQANATTDGEFITLLIFT